MTTHATFDAQQAAWFAEVCGNCGCQRRFHDYDYDAETGAKWGECACAQCEAFE